MRGFLHFAFCIFHWFKVGPMGKHPHRADPSAPGAPQADDLKRIPGIGPVIERHLHERGVRTFAQLATRTPEELAGLVAHLPLLSAERIVRQDWIGRARALAREPLGSAAERDPAQQREQRSATFALELRLDRRNQVVHTHVMHEQDGAEASWAGWSAEQLLAFIHTHAVDPGSIPAEDAPMTPETTAQPPAATDPPLPGSLPGSTDLTLEPGTLHVETVPLAEADAPGLQAMLTFHFGGTVAQQLVAAGAPYGVAVLAADTTTGAIQSLGALHGRLHPGRLSYETLVELVPPQAGRFLVFGVVTVVQAGLITSMRGPILRVMA
jgi:hypothetical protein